ncbi:hypothetical protein QA634_09610 [Methylobacterium sp. CB376]|uniref:hypothetical protein n=1 Tax=unclassified Methylobacterium TaxID=2615210 RepID=UPI000681A4F2|nr:MULTISPECIES: hypothetical protein [Methylobacterium]WFT82083.1 hypothetical protein QA634_09610 [Methylobacterium nodulans]
MRTTLCVCMFAITAAAAPVRAGDTSMTVSPPLFREMARETAKVRPSSELSVSPQPVAASRQPQLGAAPEAPARTGSID